MNFQHDSHNKQKCSLVCCSAQPSHFGNFNFDVQRYQTTIIINCNDVQKFAFVSLSFAILPQPLVRSQLNEKQTTRTAKNHRRRNTKMCSMIFVTSLWFSQKKIWNIKRKRIIEVNIAHGRCHLLAMSHFSHSRSLIIVYNAHLFFEYVLIYLCNLWINVECSSFFLSHLWTCDIIHAKKEVV